MEYRDKVTTELSGKKLFLQNSQVEHEKPDIYSLETEFAKTKKNHDLKPYLVFGGFITLLILSTVATTNYLEVQSKQVNIDISDFEDLRLKETLNAAKEKELELNRKTEELNTKAEELKNKTGELKNLKSSFNSQVQQIKEELQEQSDLKNADKKALQRLDTKSKKQIDDIKNRYEKLYARQYDELEALKLRQKELDGALKQYVALFDKYQYGFRTFLKEKKAAGCIIDPRQRGSVIVFINKDRKITTETLVEVYRGENVYIGKLQLIPGETGLQAKVVEVASHQNIMPLDWFQLPK